MNQVLHHVEHAMTYRVIEKVAPLTVIVKISATMRRTVLRDSSFERAENFRSDILYFDLVIDLVFQ